MVEEQPVKIWGISLLKFEKLTGKEGLLRWEGVKLE